MSKRMGIPKQLMDYNGKPMLRVVVENTIKAPVDEIIVVLGNEAIQAARSLEGLAVKLAVNKNYAKGQSTSVRAGLELVERRARGVLFVLGDQPLVKVETIRLLVDSFKEKGGIAAPFYNGVRGNPVLFENSLLQCADEIQGDQGARGIIELHPGLLNRVDVNDPGVLIDIDTWEDYRRLSGGEGGAGE
ncbi:MAG: hypothetical protein JL50_15975 [Peptococcaceae bacterium BICA1-7]|nr:MAG: hypothetical protein JL50_15975 [Peptococcaceae bacterium BICA1-7]